MIPNFIKANDNIRSLRVEKMEADDLIAIICTHMRSHIQDPKIYLVSGDEDFLQLGRPNLIFVNYKAKKAFELTEEEAATSLKNKLILGDSSDCIAGIFKKVKGNKIKKADLLESDDKLEEYLNLNPDAKKQY